jgi:uncharacterized membrane protein
MTVSQLFLIIHILAVALGLGIGFSNLVGFRVAGQVGGDMAKGIAKHRETLIPYVDVFYVTIVGSGLVLLFNLGGAAGLGPWFHAKLAAVALWVAAYVVMRLRVRKFLASRDMALVPMIRILAQVAITAATLALIFAVMTFNA